MRACVCVPGSKAVCVCLGEAGGGSLPCWRILREDVGEEEVRTAAMGESDGDLGLTRNLSVGTGGGSSLVGEGEGWELGW